MGMNPAAHVRFGIAFHAEDNPAGHVPSPLRYDGPDTGLSEDELDTIQVDVWSWIEAVIDRLDLDHPGGFEVGNTGGHEYGGYVVYATDAPRRRVEWSETAVLPALPDLAEEYTADFRAIQEALQVEEPQSPGWILSASYG